MTTLVRESPSGPLVSVSGGGPPSGPAGGDLDGTYPDPEVIALTEPSGPTRLPLGPVGNGEYLRRVGATIVGDTPSSNPTGPAGGDLDGTYPNPEVVALTELSGPDRLAIGSILDGQLLRRVGANVVGVDMYPDIQGTYLFADLATLTAEEGAVVQVQEILGIYQYTTTQTLPANGTQVVNSSVGQWQRITVPILEWVRQTTWFILPGGGSDIADGNTSGTPLNSWAEFRARTEGGEFQAAVTVNLLGPLTTETLSWQGSANANGSLRIQSDSTAWTLLASGTVTSFTAFSVASTQSARLFDTGASFTGALVGKRIRFTSGAANNCRAFILSVPSGTELELAGMPQTLDTSTNLTPGAGSTYVIEDLPSIAMAAIDIAKGYSGAASSGLYIQELDLTSSATFNVVGARINACKLSSASASDEVRGANRMILNGCGTFRPIVTNYQLAAPNVQFVGGGGTTGVTISGTGTGVVLGSAATTFRGGASIACGPGGPVNTQNVLAFAMTSNGVSLINGSRMVVFGNGLGGSGNAGVGVDAPLGSELVWTTKPTITGSSPGVNDVSVAGVPKPWSFFAATGIIGGAQGYAAGDLAGTYPEPTVAAITETSGPTRLQIGAVATGQALVRNGSNLIGAPLFYLELDPSDALYQTTNIPAFNVEQGTNIPVETISFSANDQRCFWQKQVVGYQGQNLTVKILWASSSTSGNITFAVQLAAITPGDAQSILTKAFASEVSSGAVSPSGTADGEVATTLSFSGADLNSLADGDTLWIRLRRTAGSITGRVLGLVIS